MGTAISVQTRGDADLDPVFEWLRWVDATFGPRRPDPYEDHPLVAEVLDRCERLRELTGGAFDGDPIGFVKGWAAERATAMIAPDAYVNAGGDVRVKGAWRVGIQHPRERDAVAAVIAVTDAGVATSGGYERGAHIRGAAEDVVSVTVVGPDLGTADAYATAAVVLGPDWTATLDGYEAMTIMADGSVLETRGFTHLRIP